MHFEVRRTAEHSQDHWHWELVLKGGIPLARSPQSFDTETQARSHLAAAKKSMKGAIRCKVVTVDDTAD